jgi:hypothetical protein
MLRLPLVENLRHISSRLAFDKTDRNLATERADKLISAAEADPRSVVMVLADMARSEPSTSNVFLAEMGRPTSGA